MIATPDNFAAEFLYPNAPPEIRQFRTLIFAMNGMDNTHTFLFDTIGCATPRDAVIMYDISCSAGLDISTPCTGGEWIAANGSVSFRSYIQVPADMAIRSTVDMLTSTYLCKAGNPKIIELNEHVTRHLLDLYFAANDTHYVPMTIGLNSTNSPVWMYAMERMMSLYWRHHEPVSFEDGMLDLISVHGSPLYVSGLIAKVADPVRSRMYALLVERWTDVSTLRSLLAGSNPSMLAIARNCRLSRENISYLIDYALASQARTAMADIVAERVVAEMFPADYSPPVISAEPHLAIARRSATMNVSDLMPKRGTVEVLAECYYRFGLEPESHEIAEGIKCALEFCGYPVLEAAKYRGAPRGPHTKAAAIVHRFLQLPMIGSRLDSVPSKDALRLHRDIVRGAAHCSGCYDGCALERLTDLFAHIIEIDCNVARTAWPKRKTPIAMMKLLRTLGWCSCPNNMVLRIYDIIAAQRDRSEFSDHPVMFTEMNVGSAVLSRAVYVCDVRDGCVCSGACTGKTVNCIMCGQSHTRCDDMYGADMPVDTYGTMIKRSRSSFSLLARAITADRFTTVQLPAESAGVLLAHRAIRVTVNMAARTDATASELDEFVGVMLAVVAPQIRNVQAAMLMRLIACRGTCKRAVEMICCALPFEVTRLCEKLLNTTLVHGQMMVYDVSVAAIFECAATADSRRRKQRGGVGTLVRSIVQAVRSGDVSELVVSSWQ